jgi:hypothetical protein
MNELPTPMSIAPLHAYQCVIVWHAQPDTHEVVTIFAGELPSALHHTPIDDSLFYEMPAPDLVVGYDDGAWHIMAIAGVAWELATLG